jgi:hypothetical protein
MSAHAEAARKSEEPKIVRRVSVIAVQRSASTPMQYTRNIAKKNYINDGRVQMARH